MIAGVAARYAFRSLMRSPRRTGLTVLGIGIGCAIALVATAWMSGSAEMQIRAVAESGGGHLRIVPRGWLEKRENSLRLADWESCRAVVRTLPSVKAAMARARSNALLAFGNRTSGVEILGVQPETEAAHNRIVRRGRLEGRYLVEEDRGKVVIGGLLAQRLDVDVGDDLQCTLAGRTEIRSAMLEIVGIIATGSREIDASVCHVTLEDLSGISGFSGAGEISILLEDHDRLESVQEALAARLPPEDDVITWKEVNPGIAGNVEGDKAFTRGVALMIMIVVALGIASAQLTAVLERRREFAMLSALGMKGKQLAGLIALEALVVGTAGAAVALLLGCPAAYYLATRGFNLAAFLGDDFSFGNVLIDPYIYGDIGVWLVWHALAVSLAATMLASLYPAWFAIRTNPAEALRVV